MLLKELQNGDRFTMTISGTVVRIDAIGGGGVRVLFDGCDKYNETNTIFNSVKSTVFKELPPPAAGDIFRAKGSKVNAYVLRAILEDDQWVYSGIHHLGNVMVTHRATFDDNYTRIPKKEA